MMVAERIFRIIGSFGFTFQFRPSPLMRAENISTPDGYMKQRKDSVKNFTTTPNSRNLCQASCAPETLELNCIPQSNSFLE